MARHAPTETSPLTPLQCGEGNENDGDGSMKNGLTQKQRAKLAILEKKSPFTAIGMEESCGKAINASAWREAADDLDLLCCTKHVGSGNFRVLYFPLMWLPAKCYEYMDAHTKKGKSKVTIRAAKSGKAYERGAEYTLREFAEKLERSGVDTIEMAEALRMNEG